jgi:hypothetical protein
MTFDLLKFVQQNKLPQKPEVFLDGDCLQTFEDFKKQYKKQSGVYGWVHKQSLKTYVGSALNLSVRPFQHLMGTTRSNKHLFAALQKDGLATFVLVLFKSLGSSKKVSKDQLIEMENVYLTLVKNKYNILEKAYTSIGYQHSKRCKERLSLARQGSQNPIFGKVKSSEFLCIQKKPKKGRHNHMSKPVQWIHRTTKEVLVLESQIEAALAFGYQTKYVIVKAIKDQSLFKGVWVVSYLST